MRPEQNGHLLQTPGHFQCDNRAHSGYELSQWETTLQCNVVSHWLRPYTEWSMNKPLPEPMWTKISDALLCHQFSILFVARRIFFTAVSCFIVWYLPMNGFSDISSGFSTIKNVILGQYLQWKLMTFMLSMLGCAGGSSYCVKWLWSILRRYLTTYNLRELRTASFQIFIASFMNTKHFIDANND